jgi:hypothetical protein
MIGCSSCVNTCWLWQTGEWLVEKAHADSKCCRCSQQGHDITLRVTLSLLPHVSKTHPLPHTSCDWLMQKRIWSLILLSEERQETKKKYDQECVHLSSNYPILCLQMGWLLEMLSNKATKANFGYSAYLCREELRRWFLGMETTLFRQRFRSETPESQVQTFFLTLPLLLFFFFSLVCLHCMRTMWTSCHSLSDSSWGDWHGDLLVAEAVYGRVQASLQSH